MIANLPHIQVPETFSRLCCLKLTNTRICYGEISDILQEDQFLMLYIKNTFSKYLKKGGTLGMLTALGWEGFRNRLAEAFIFKARYGKYPTQIELDEVHDVLDIEKRFDFISNESSGRVFLFGLYIKLCDIYIEKNQEFVGADFITIPLEVDEILAKGKSKGFYPDWLVVITWILYERFGEEKTFELYQATKGKFSLIAGQLEEDQLDQMMASLINYGYGIHDYEFLSPTKV